jgi:hypothetical protein
VMVMAKKPRNPGIETTSACQGVFRTAGSVSRSVFLDSINSLRTNASIARSAGRTFFLSDEEWTLPHFFHFP